jgi:hypothetical protein
MEFRGRGTEMKMTFAEKQQEHQTLLQQAFEKLKQKSIKELKRYLKDSGPKIK